MKTLVYKINKAGHSITTCNRSILVGSRECLGCSYCYFVSEEDKKVACRKMDVKIKNIKLKIMSKYFFYTKESENCFKKETIKEMMKLNGLKKADVFEAKLITDVDFMYCTIAGDIGDKGWCGKDCKDYKPRNGISGNCLHNRGVYDHGNKITIKIS